MVPRLQGASRGESGDSPNTLLTHSEEWVHPGAEATESDKPGQIVSAAPRSSVSPEGDGVSASRDLASAEAWSLSAPAESPGIRIFRLRIRPLLV